MQQPQSNPSAAPQQQPAEGQNHADDLHRSSHHTTAGPAAAATPGSVAASTEELGIRSDELTAKEKARGDREPSRRGAGRNGLDVAVEEHTGDRLALDSKGRRADEVEVATTQMLQSAGWFLSPCRPSIPHCEQLTRTAITHTSYIVQTHLVQSMHFPGRCKQGCYGYLQRCIPKLCSCFCAVYMCKHIWRWPVYRTVCSRVSSQQSCLLLACTYFLFCCGLI